MWDWLIPLIAAVGTAALTAVTQYFRQVKPALEQVGKVAEAAEAQVAATENKGLIFATKLAEFAADGKITADEVKQLMTIAQGTDQVDRMITVVSMARANNGEKKTAE